MAKSEKKASDTITVMFPYDQFKGRRNGTHPGKTFAVNPVNDTAFDPTKQKWYQLESITFSNIAELHVALVGIAQAGKAFVCRGAPALADGSICRRLKAPRASDTAGQTDPAAVQDVIQHVLAIDADKWPNIMGFDPRTQSVEAWRWMLSVLGSEFKNLKVSAFWSSSCCVRAVYEPETLSARFWVWLDTPLNEVDAVLLSKRLDARVKAYYESARTNENDTSTYMSEHLVFEKTQMLVDPRVAQTNQAIYCAAPVFHPGVVDPLPGARYALLTGKRNSLNVAALLKSLPTLEHARKTKSASGDRKPRERKLPKARSTTVRIPGQVIPLAAAAREIEAMRSACKAAISGTDEEYRAACENLFHRRVALEMLALAAHRGGLHEGFRDLGCLMISSAVVASLPLTTTEAEGRRQVRAVLRLVVSEEWLDAEWEGKSDKSVWANFEAAQRGEKSRIKIGSDPRYTYFKSRLLEEWQPTLKEVTELGLMSLLSEKQRSEIRRAAKRAAKPETEWQIKVRTIAPELHQLKETGATFSEMVDATGLPRGTVQRLLAAVVHAPVADPVPVQVPGVTAPVIAAPAVAAYDLPYDDDDEVIEFVWMFHERGLDYAEKTALDRDYTCEQVERALSWIETAEQRRPAALALAA